MYAPKAAARKYEIGPDETTEDSGSDEHFRYCTAQWNSGWDEAHGAQKIRGHCDPGCSFMLLLRRYWTLRFTSSSTNEVCRLVSSVPVNLITTVWPMKEFTLNECCW